MTSSPPPSPPSPQTHEQITKDPPFPFSHVVKFYEKITTTRTQKKKRQLLDDLWKLFEPRTNTFSLMRLLLPQCDNIRGRYGMKESALAEFYRSAFGLGKNNQHFLLLKHFRNPPFKIPSGLSIGDFGNVVHYVAKNRTQFKSTLTIQEINSALNQFADATGNTAKNEALKQLLVKRATPLENKWIIRIILQDLKLHCSEKVILEHYHRDAQKYYSATSNLELVCSKLLDPNVRIESQLGTENHSKGADAALASSKHIFTSLVQIGTPFSPMLGEKCGSIDDAAKIAIPVAVETKYDGNRLLIHKDGKHIQLFSRNAHSHYQTQLSCLIPFLRAAIRVKRCIIDSEVLVYNQQEQVIRRDNILTAGAGETQFCLSNPDLQREYFTNFSNPHTVKATKDYSSQVHMYLKVVMFDLLYVNHESLVNKPHSLRYSTLLKVLKSPNPFPKRLEFSDLQLCYSAHEIDQRLENAITNNQEGIMVKDPKSPYLLNSRGSTWLKIKPDFFKGIADTQDFLVIGGYYGTGQRHGGKLSHFMVGVPAHGVTVGRESHPFPQDDADLFSNNSSSKAHQSTPLTISTSAPVFWSVGKVGTGFGDENLEIIKRKFGDKFHPYSIHNPPDCLVLSPPFQEKPDVWIDPRDSFIIEVRAAQFVKTEKFRSGVTFRFPRCDQVRYDKMWYECQTLDNILKLFQQGNLTKRNRNQTALASGRSDRLKTSNRYVSTGVAQHFLPTDTSQITVLDGLFLGSEFCVLVTEDCSHSKQFLETSIAQHSGTFVQHPTPLTACIITNNIMRPKVATYIDSGLYDVVDYQYILECIRAKRMIPLQPKYIFYAKLATKNHVSKRFDFFGLKYRQIIKDPQHLIPVLVQVQKNLIDLYSVKNDEFLNAVRKNLSKYPLANCLLTNGGVLNPLVQQMAENIRILFEPNDTKTLASLNVFPKSLPNFVYGYNPWDFQPSLIPLQKEIRKRKSFTENESPQSKSQEQKKDPSTFQFEGKNSKVKSARRKRILQDQSKLSPYFVSRYWEIDYDSICNLQQCIQEALSDQLYLHNMKPLDSEFYNVEDLTEIFNYDPSFLQYYRSKFLKEHLFETFFTELSCKWNLFCNKCFYFDMYDETGKRVVSSSSSLDFYQPMIKIYGGSLSLSKNDSRITHYVFDPKDLSRLHLFPKVLSRPGQLPIRLKNISFVWIQDCIDANKIFDELTYPPQTNSSQNM